MNVYIKQSEHNYNVLPFVDDYIKKDEEKKEKAKVVKRKVEKTILDELG